MTILLCWRHITLSAVVTIACSVAACLLSDTVDAQEVARSLKPEDQALLSRVLDEFLFDPEGAERVRVNTTVRNVWGGETNVTRDGWLVVGDGDAHSHVFFAGRRSIVVPDGQQLERVNFVADCRTRFSGSTPESQSPEEFRREQFRRMRRNAVADVVDDSDLSRAVWLHRLGHEDLAALALQSAREVTEGDDVKMIANLRSNLAWSAFAEMVHAYMVRADEEALKSGEQLLQLYPKEAKDEYPQAAAIVADLKRRKENGSFGPEASRVSKPAGFKNWDVDQQVAFLIDQLDEVDARQMSQPGHVALSTDRRVAALIRVGDEAVPALIDTIENDNRLTRSVHFWRDFSRNRTVLSVREAALEATMTILRVQAFEVHATGDNFTSRGDEAAKQLAGHLRAYWQKYGSLPFDERMMKVLNDPDSRFERTREAAYNLAHLGEQRWLSTSGAMITRSRSTGDRRKTSSPAVEKFDNPTAAEAILTAMDRDLENYDSNPRDNLYEYRRRQIEDQYLEPLIHLGDKRIADELKRRYQGAPTIRARRKWANAAHHLGNSEAMKDFAGDIEEGALTLPDNDRPNKNERDQPGNVELQGIIQDLARAATPEADRALFAIAEPDHPYFGIAMGRVMSSSLHWSDDESWFAHAYCLQILRRELDNQQLTGGTYRIDGANLIHEFGDGSMGTTSIPPFLSDPNRRRPKADERQCDRAATKLQELVIGLPQYHLLDANADETLESLKRIFDSFRNGYRRMTPLEGEFLSVFPSETRYIPDLPPLERPATQQDVDEGRAIFHLAGNGKLAELQLPAVASLKSGDDGPMNDLGRKKSIMIVQAEINDDGKTIYGVIGDGAGRVAKPEELEEIKPIKKSFSILDLFK